MKPTFAQIRPVANPLLSNMLIAYMNDDTDFVARRAAPVVSVEEESGTYLTIEQRHWLADKLERRAYGDTYARGGYTFGSDTYKTLQWGLEHVIPVEHQRASQLPMRLEQIGLNWLAQQSNIRKEKAFAADFMVTGIWGTSGTPTDWDDASGVPITDSDTARRTIRLATGENANAIVMGEIVFAALKTNAQVLARMQYTQTMTVANVESLIGAMLGFDTLLVGRAVSNVANVGQTVDIDPIIDDDALVFVLAPGADMMSASAMKTFAWDSGEGTVNTYLEPETRNSTVLQHTEQWDQKMISSALGYFFEDIV